LVQFRQKRKEVDGMGSFSYHVGQRIKKYRKSRGYTIEQFSAMINKSKATVSKYENGTITIDVETLYDVARALDIDLKCFIDYQPPVFHAQSVLPKNFYFNQPRAYMYYYDGRVRQLVRSLLCFSPSASGDDVISINDNDNVFQICFTDSNQGSRSAQYIDENFDSPKIAIIYKNDDQYSIGIRDNFKAEADSRGMDIVYEGTFTEASQTDFNVQLAGAQSAGADLLFLPIYYTPASVILTQANAMGYAPTFFGVDGMDGILTAENFDASLAEGVYLLTPFSADSEDEMTQNFVAEYQDRFGEIPNQFGADAYDAIYTLYQAIQAAGATADMSNEEICDALIEVMPTLAVTGLTSAGSEMTWDENGAVSKDPTAVIIENGTYVTP